ncbi:hypothetical protein C4569_02575 [Candidatus Parcubacteria bacterium]|nr:MAG: hypothetical protein C4569_02575 [Candidatus Parcubacteria bacterium]
MSIQKMILVLFFLTAFFVAILFDVYNVLNIKASIYPGITVWPKIISYGTSFPKEIRLAVFEITETTKSDNAVFYKIDRQRKALPEIYDGNGEDPLLPGYLRNLCPYLVVEPINPKKETENGTYLLDQAKARWSVNFFVPPINGQSSQTYLGVPVNGAGDYGCDLVLNFESTDGKAHESESQEKTPALGSFTLMLIIHSEKTENITATSADAVWLTNLPATSRVVYGTKSFRTEELKNEYSFGYEKSTFLDSTEVLSHKLNLTELLPETTYFWRALSGSGELKVFSQEVSFKTLAASAPKEKESLEKKFTVDESKIIKEKSKKNGEKKAYLLFLTARGKLTPEVRLKPIMFVQPARHR